MKGITRVFAEVSKNLTQWTTAGGVSLRSIGAGIELIMYADGDGGQFDSQLSAEMRICVCNGMSTADNSGGQLDYWRGFLVHLDFSTGQQVSPHVKQPQPWPVARVECVPTSRRKQ